METRELDPLFDPSSLAIVGASPDSWYSSRITEHLVDYGYDGDLYLVNPNRETAWDRQCHDAISDLPEVVDLVVVVVPREHVVDVVREAGEVGVPAALVITTGFSEADERGAELVREIAERAGVDPDEYTVEVVVDDDVRSAILETVGRYDTICAGLSRRTAESRLPVGFVVTDLGRRVPGTVALVRGTGSNDTAVGPSGQSEP